jgi:hypothetical protein
MAMGLNQRPTFDYRLLDGRIVAIHEDVCRSHPLCSLQLAGGEIVQAVRHRERS